MWVVTYLILLLWIGRPLRSEGWPPSYRNERLFTDTIDSVVLDMTRQYFARENDLSFYDGNPLKAEKTLFHGFTPDTGYNNREDLLIQNIYEKRLWTNSSPKLWRYIRFNNSDFLLSVGNENAFMWQIHLVENWMKLETSTAIFTYTTNNGIIIDSITFGKTYEQLQMLAVVILEASEYASRLTVYQVVNGYSNQAMLLNLDDTPTKVDYVSTRFDSSIILLYHSSSGFDLKYIENGIGCWKNIIKIWLPNPVDLETFVINGLGYVAVANSSTCLIFKLDWFLQSHTELEILHLDSIRDLHSFRISFEHFLSIIASYEQHLLVWRNGKFHRKQLLKFPNAIRLHTAPLSSCRDDIVALLFQDTIQNSVSLLSWHSRDQKLLVAPPQIMQSFPKDINLLPGSIASFVYNKTTYLLSVDRRIGPRLFALNASLKPLPDPFLNRVKELENLIKHIQGRFEEYMINVGHLSLVLEHAVTDSSLIFKPQVFHKMNVLQKSVGALKMLKSLSLEGSQSTLDNFKWTTINSFNLKLSNVEQNLEDVLFDLQDVALLDQSTVMTGTNSIRSAEGSSLGALVLDVQNIAATDLINLQGSTYRSDNPLLINGEVSFVLPVTVRESVDVGCCVNNFDLDQHIMATDKDQDSTAYYYMRRPIIIENSLHVAGTVNNVDLSEELVTLHKKHKIKAHKIMKDSIHIYENLTVKLIDGIDVKEMKRFSLTENSTQIILRKEFSQDVRVQDVTITGVFNNIKLNALGANILRIDKLSSILGKKTFEDNFSAIDRLSVKGTIDKLNLPNDLFTSNSPQNLTAPKTFHDYVSVTKTYVSGLVDQISTLKLVTLTLEDSLYDKVFARGMGVDEDVIIGRFVDNVDISNITLLIKSDSHLSGKTTFLAGVAVEQNLDVQKKINELDVKMTYRDAIIKTNMVDIYSRKVFNALTISSSTINTINGLRMEDFMLTWGNQLLRGTKFLDETTFLDLQSGLSIVDQVDLALLETERISRSSSSTIKGPLNFFEILFVENATAGTVDGVIIQNAVVVSLPQEVETKIFKPYLVDNQNKEPSLFSREMRIRGDVEVATTLDAVDLTELARRRITISSNQNILVELIFGDNDAVLIETDRVNDFNFTRLSRNVMSLSKAQTVFEKSFESQISIFGDIGTSEGVSNIRVDWVNSNAIHLNEDHILSGYFTFVNVLSVAEDLVLQERVSGINIAQLIEDSVMIEGHHILTQPVRFQSLLQIDGDINAELVNGVYLPEKLLTLTAPQILTGVFVFEHGLGLSSDLLTSGLINGIDVSYLSALTMKLDLNNKLHGNLAFVEDMEIKELSVSNLVNGKNVSMLQTEAVLVNEIDYITTLKSISNDVFVKRDLATNVVNNVYMEHFVADLIWITGDQNIPTPKTFNEEVVILNNLRVLGPTIVSTIEGTDIARLAKEAVYVDKPQKIEDVKIFINFIDIDGTITIYGPINNIDLSVGAITVNRTEGDIQLIYGEKSFTMVLFKDHITVTQRVNSLLLKEHLRNTLLTTGNQITSGYKMIRGNLLCEQDLHLSTVNNISIREAVNLHSENLISGELKFSGGVKSRNLYVEGLINKIDVRVLIEEAVYLDTTQKVSEEFFLSEVLVQKDLLVGREVDNIDLDKLDKSVVSFDILFAAETQDFLKETSIQRYIGDYLWDILEESLYQLDKFVFYASLNVTGDFLDILPEATDFNIVKMPRNSYYGRTYTFVLEHSKLLYLDSIATTTTIRRVPILILKRVFIIYVAAAHSAVDTTIMQMDEPVASLGQGILDVSVINRDEYHCNIIVLDVEGTCKIYIFGSLGYKSLLTEVTSVHIGKEATAIAGFLLHKEVHVAVARRFPSLYTQGSSLLLKLRNRNLELVQEIAAPASNDVVYFEYGVKHYLVFTNVAPVHEALETNSVQVYRTCNYLETPFRLYQKISFNNPTSLEVFELGNLQELYMIISNSTGVEFYHLQGERGFISTTMLVREDVRDVKPFVAKDELYVAIAQGEIALSSTILKAKMKGSIVPPRFKIHWP